MTKTVTKICGITNLKDALFAFEAGAGLLGFNFYEPSPRFVSPSAAADIIAQCPQAIRKIGVFVNADIETVLSIVEKTGIDGVQLHGDEDQQYISKIRRQTDVELIKAFRVNEEFESNDVLIEGIDAVLLDAFSDKLYGGTGDVFDWSMAAEVKEHVSRLYLAGGLGADNVAAAVSQVRPFAVDACSRLEAKPGIKDATLVGRFLSEVSKANGDLECTNE